MIMILVTSFIILAGALTIMGWPSDPCDSWQCNSALDRLPNIYCKGGAWSIMINYGGFCEHGLCFFDITIYCENGDEHDVTLLCMGACPK